MHTHKIKKVFVNYHHSRCVHADCASKWVILNKKEIFLDISIIILY